MDFFKEWFSQFSFLSEVNYEVLLHFICHVFLLHCLLGYLFCLQVFLPNWWFSSYLCLTFVWWWLIMKQSLRMHEWLQKSILPSPLSVPILIYDWSLISVLVYFTFLGLSELSYGHTTTVKRVSKRKRDVWNCFPFIYLVKFGIS